MTDWNKAFDFAEGDSGVYIPGQSVAAWNATREAEKNKPPRKLTVKPIGEVQADLIEIATDKNNDANVRVDAYRLAIEIGVVLHEAGLNPLGES